MYLDLRCPSCEVRELKSIDLNDSFIEQQLKEELLEAPHWEGLRWRFEVAQNRAARAKADLPNARNLIDRTERAGWQVDRDVSLEALERAEWVPQFLPPQNTKMVKRSGKGEEEMLAVA